MYILMTVYLLKKKFFFQNKQKIVQTLLQWLFWTSINLDIISKNIILAEVFVSISWIKGSLATSYIYMIFKNK